MLARVIDGGPIGVGDAVAVLEALFGDAATAKPVKEAARNNAPRNGATRVPGQRRAGRVPPVHLGHPPRRSALYPNAVIVRRPMMPPAR